MCYMCLEDGNPEKEYGMLVDQAANVLYDFTKTLHTIDNRFPNTDYYKINRMYDFVHEWSIYVNRFINTGRKED